MKTRLAISGLCGAVAALSLAVGCAPTERLPDPEYVVYNAFLSEVLRDVPEESIQTLVIREDTDVYDREHLEERLSSWATHMPGVEDSTLRSFADRNKPSIRLRHEFDVRVPITLVSEETLETFRAGNLGFYEQLRREFPGGQGLMTLSRVGFNEAGTQALLYYANGRDSLGGFGRLVLLALEGDRWILKESSGLWVS